MREPTQSEVINAVNQGIRKAQEDYKKAYMSHISSSYAPEYLMTVYIFQSILKLKRKCNCPYGLSLEEPVFEVARALGVRGRYPRDARASGYCDLLLRDIHDKPRVVVEVKKNAWDYGYDLARLAYLVNRGLEFGVFASCWFEEVKDNNHGEAEDRVKEEIRCIDEHISDDIRRQYSRTFIKTKFGDTERLVLEGEVARHEEFVWCPVCFVVCREGEVANTRRQY